MRPLIPQLVEQIDVAERAEHAAHEPGLSHGLLDGVEAVIDRALRADDACQAAGYLPGHVERARHGLLSRRDGVGEMLHRLQPRVDDRHRDHPNAMLHAGRQKRDLGKQALIRRTGHDLVWVALGPAIRTHDDDGGAEILDKVPAGAGDGEDVDVVVDVA